MLKKPLALLVLGVVTNFICISYIFNSAQLESYLAYMLKDFDNPSGAFIGLTPEFNLVMNSFFGFFIHLIAIGIFNVLRNPSIFLFIKKFILFISTLLFLAFCLNRVILLSNMIDDYVFILTIANLCWILYGALIIKAFFSIHFESQKQ